jgi:hypothetical protein
MVNIRSTSEIIRSYLDFLRVAQPKLDTKVGSTSRDVIVDGNAAQLSLVYDELGKLTNAQSFRTAIGTDIDRWAQNIGETRQKGSRARVSALFLFNNFNFDIPITNGDLVFAKNGSTFKVLTSQVLNVAQQGSFSSIAAKYRADLDFAGFTEPYAAEVLLEATSVGEQGNIPKFGLQSVSIAGISNVTNVFPAGGGSGSENDILFKNRILAIFSGAVSGTATGYENIVRSDPAVIDAIVIGPGDDLMIRDGTIVKELEDGTRKIVSEGTGGKVDVIVFGSRLQENSNSFIYQDRSNTGLATNIKNDYVLGQISSDSNKSITKRRLDNLLKGTLPAQPINNIIGISGSLSGSNFVEKTVDDLGRVSGNYELIRDTGAFGGTPWGFDKIRWISNYIKDFQEDKTKASFNSQDPLGFTDVTEINRATQNIQINNENSKISATDRSIIQLKNYPATAVTRVFNLTTGERYRVVNQNPDGSGFANMTGRIIISGKSLPSTSDVLQVDYTWIKSYDQYWDFDNKNNISTNIRNVNDSLDWGYSNVVRRERATLATSGSYLTCEVTHEIFAVTSVNIFEEESAVVSFISDRFVTFVSDNIFNIVSIIRTSDNAELWNTNKSDGSISGSVAYFPTDSSVQFGDEITVVYNSTDVYNADITGSFNERTINISPSVDATAGAIVEINYLANVNILLPSTALSNLPAIKNFNNFNVNNVIVGIQPTTHLYSGNDIIQNLRQAPSTLILNLVGSLDSQGTISIAGTTMYNVVDIIFTATSAGLTQDISAAVRTALSISSQGSTADYKLARVSKMQKVETTSSLQELAVLANYDLLGYSIKDNLFVKEESIQDVTLGALQLKLPRTTNNIANQPTIGDRLKITCYLYKNSDSENIYFSRSGLAYTNKKYLSIDSISVSSGFISPSAQACTLSISNLNQPTSKSRYRAYYNYTAPKNNERITVNYNYNKLLGDTALLLERRRFINADVITKECEYILLDATINIVVLPEYVNSSRTVQQNVADVVTNLLNSQRLGQIIDQSDLINAAYTVPGVDRARILYFNKNGEQGSILSFVAKKNQVYVANNVIANIENR